MKLFLFTMVTQALDVALTYIGLQHGYGEGNPIAALIIHAVGFFPAIAAIKGFALFWFWTLFKQGKSNLIFTVNVVIWFVAIIPWTLILYG